MACHPIIVVMGVSGSGKSVVGAALAAALDYEFIDADLHHPSANVEKMSRGVPLTDDDRWPWLHGLRSLLDTARRRGSCVVLACSALRARYREVLLGEEPSEVLFVHLKGSFELIESRMRARHDHFMKSGMLRSQFETLEEPKDALTVSIEGTPDEIVRQIVAHECA